MEMFRNYALYYRTYGCDITNVALETSLRIGYTWVKGVRCASVLLRCSRLMYLRHGLRVFRKP